MPTFNFTAVDAMGVEVADKSTSGRPELAVGGVFAGSGVCLSPRPELSPHRGGVVRGESSATIPKRLRKDYGGGLVTGGEVVATGERANATVPVVPKGKLWRHDAAIRAMILQGMGYRGIADRLLSEHGCKVTVRAVQLYGRKLCHGDLFHGLKQERAASSSIRG